MFATYCVIPHFQKLRGQRLHYVFLPYDLKELDSFSSKTFIYTGQNTTQNSVTMLCSLWSIAWVNGLRLEL